MPPCDARVLGNKVEDHIHIPVSIYIFHGRVHGRDFTASRAKRTVVGSTEVASKEGVVRIATGIFPLLFSLMIFGNVAGLISIEIGSGPNWYSMSRASSVDSKDPD